MQAESYYKMAIDRVAMKGIHEPTVIAPPEYSKRFQEAMARNFAHSPSTFAIRRHQNMQHVDAEGAGGITHGTMDWGVHDISGLFRENSREDMIDIHLDGDQRRQEGNAQDSRNLASTSTSMSTESL
jgi:hypothetical protein